MGRQGSERGSPSTQKCPGVLLPVTERRKCPMSPSLRRWYPGDRSRVPRHQPPFTERKYPEILYLTVLYRISDRSLVHLVKNDEI